MTPRPRTFTALVAVVGFLALTALGGGIAMTFGLGGDKVMPPAAWLDEIPLIDSWVLPGLMLGIGFGLGSALVAWGLVRRTHLPGTAPLERATGRHWSWTGALVLGIGHTAWIALEFLWLPEVSSLMIAYGIVAVIIVTLAATGSVRSHMANPTLGT